MSAYSIRIVFRFPFMFVRFQFKICRMNGNVLEESAEMMMRESERGGGERSEIEREEV